MAPTSANAPPGAVGCRGCRGLRWAPMVAVVAMALVASRRSSGRRTAGYDVNEAIELEDTMAPTLAEVPRGTKGRRGCRRRRLSQGAPRALVKAVVPVPVALGMPAATLPWRLSLLPLVDCCRRLKGVCSACIAVSPCSVQSAVATLLPAEERLSAPFLSCSCEGGGRVRRTSRSACVALPPCSLQSDVVKTDGAGRPCEAHWKRASGQAGLSRTEGAFSSKPKRRAAGATSVDAGLSSESPNPASKVSGPRGSEARAMGPECLAQA